MIIPGTPFTPDISKIINNTKRHLAEGFCIKQGIVIRKVAEVSQHSQDFASVILMANLNLGTLLGRIIGLTRGRHALTSLIKTIFAKLKKFEFRAKVFTLFLRQDFSSKHLMAKLYLGTLLH